MATTTGSQTQLSAQLQVFDFDQFHQTVVSHLDESENLNYLVDTRLNLLVRDTCSFGAWDTRLDLVSTPMTSHLNRY